MIARHPDPFYAVPLPSSAALSRLTDADERGMHLGITDLENKNGRIWVEAGRGNPY